jgi:hypothetical protein
VKVYELINELLLMPAGADVRAINSEDREALVLFVESAEYVDGDSGDVAALYCAPAPPQHAPGCGCGQEHPGHP